MTPNDPIYTHDKGIVCNIDIWSEVSGNLFIYKQVPTWLQKNITEPRLLAPSSRFFFRN